MASKNHRQGNKMGGRHTTVIDAAQKIVDLAQKMPEVKKVVAGYITSGIRGGKQHVKIEGMVGGLLLKVRGSTCIQEVRVYSKNIKETQGKIERELS
ncbi:MAG: DUF2103 domain-containing protein [Candidatus Moraniibacteriota bacterium]